LVGNSEGTIPSEGKFYWIVKNEFMWLRRKALFWFL
jgi:hypothetical protein